MRKIFKKTLFMGLFFARNLLNPFLNFKEVSVLCYHSVSDDNIPTSVSKENFEKQIDFLKKKNYYFASLGDIADYAEGKKRLPKKTVALTFDDGYGSLFENALPVLDKYKIPATVFMISDYENGRKNLKNNLELLSDEQVSKMKERGVKFECHSGTHRMLDSLPVGEIKKEVERNGCDYFAYPGGHCSFEVVEAVKEAGYRAAFSIRPGLVKKGDDLFYIKRNVILGGDSFREFKARVTKAADWYKRLARLFK